MKRYFALFLALLLCVSLFGCTKADPTPTEPVEKVYTLKENIANFKVYGRNTLTDTGLVVDETASGIEFTVNASGPVTVQMTVSGDCYFTVFIDGVRSDKRVNAFPFKDGYPLEVANFAEAGQHTIMLLKETEASKSLCLIESVTFKGELLAAPANKDLFIEFIGDSITCGYGNLCQNGALNPGSPMYEDGTSTYAVLAALALNADFRVVSCSGIGVGDGWVDQNMDQYFSTQSYYRDQTVAYEPDRIPDLIVINLGTNDDGKDTLDAILAQAAPALIELIRDFYGVDVPIIWARGMMGEARWTTIGSILKYKYTDADMIFDVELPENRDGGGEHPDAATHVAASEILAEYITSILPLIGK